MFIVQIYKYRYNNIVYVGGEVPESAEILETMDILNAEEGYTLIRKSDFEDVGYNIWLHNNDIQENYGEKIKEENEEE